MSTIHVTMANSILFIIDKFKRGLQSKKYT